MIKDIEKSDPDIYVTIKGLLRTMGLFNEEFNLTDNCLDSQKYLEKIDLDTMLLMFKR